MRELSFKQNEDSFQVSYILYGKAFITGQIKAKSLLYDKLAHVCIYFLYNQENFLDLIRIIENKLREKTKALVILASLRKCKLVVNNKIKEEVLEVEYLRLKLPS